MQSQSIQIWRGIFQHDSLSPLLFCIPLTTELNRADCGYQVHGTERKRSHLLYMDDPQLLNRNENDLQNEIKIVQGIRKDINTNFGLEKCAPAGIRSLDHPACSESLYCLRGWWWWCWWWWCQFLNKIKIGSKTCRGVSLLNAYDQLEITRWNPMTNVCTHIRKYNTNIWTNNCNQLN
jgi:hypothetical protein